MSAFSFIETDAHSQAAQPAEDTSAFSFISAHLGAEATDTRPVDPVVLSDGAATHLHDAKLSPTDLMGKADSASDSSLETTAIAELDAQIVEGDNAVRTLDERIASLDLEKHAAANAKDFRSASRLSKELQVAEQERAAKQVELNVLKAARASNSPETRAEPDDESLTAAQAPSLPPGWQKLPSKQYPGRCYYFHEATSLTQWEVPTADPLADNASAGASASGSLDAVLAELARERELHEAAEARAQIVEQRLAVVEANLRNETSAVTELRTAQREAEIAAEQEKAAAVAVAHQAGVTEGLRQMEEQMQELQDRIESSTATIAAAQAEVSEVKAELADAVQKRQVAELAAQELRTELQALKATPVPVEYTESESDSSCDVEEEKAETAVKSVGIKPTGCDSPAALSMTQSQSDEGTMSYSPQSVSQVDVTFTKPGSLGLRLSPSTPTGKVQLIGINKGTQAEQHPQIFPGMSLESIAGVSIIGRPYKEVLGIIKQSPRPITISFVLPSNESDLITVTLMKPGALGMRFGKGKENSVELVHINPASQAADHSQLQPGLVVHSVRGVDCTGKTFQEVLRRIKLPERPVQICFKSPDDVDPPETSVNFANEGCIDKNDGMRVVVPRSEWKTTAAAKAIIKMQQADEEEVMSLPRSSDTPCRLDTLADRTIIQAKVAEARDLAAEEAAKATDAQVAKLREEAAEELRHLQVTHATEVQRYQSFLSAEQASHQASRAELETALQQRDSANLARDRDRNEQEAKFRAELQVLRDELESKDSLHTMQLAAAAKLEDRWRDSVKEAQKQRQERQGRDLRRHDEFQDDLDENIFVCYLCQKSAISL